MPPHGRQKQTQKVDTLGFPMMEVDEIIPLLNELNIKASPQDLYRPTAASVQSLWLQMLESLTGASPDMIENPRRALLGMLEYQEVYSDTLSILMLYRHCRILAESCNVTQFLFTDLVRPEPLRLRLILSGIMNFAKFREERSGPALALAMQAHDLNERVNTLRVQLDKIDADIKDIEIKNAEDLPKTEQIKKQNAEIHAELYEMHNEHHRILKELEELKGERAAVSEDVIMLNRELNHLEQQTKDTKARIVRSPERIKRHISDMSHNVSHERQQHAALVAKSRDLAKRLEVYGGLETELRGLIELERDIEAQRAIVEEATRKCNRLRSDVESARIEGESQGERVKQLDRQIKNAEDRLARQMTIITEYRADAANKIQALKDEYLEKSKNRQVQNKLRERIMHEQRAVENERNAFLQTKDDELSELLGQYWEMRKEAEDYMKTLSVQLGLEAYGFHM